jgi:hypothetical protein
MVSFLDNQYKPSVSKQDYEIFKKEYIFDKLKGYEYGRAFCLKFNVKDTVINCLIDDDIAKEMIEDIYIQ